MEDIAQVDNSRERILDAAEEAFGAFGFSGAGMKAIAQEAGVAQGLLHYHYDNKEGLYAAVIERRSGVINGERLEKLSHVDTSSPDAVSQILRAFLEPPLGVDGGGRSYARILAGLCAGDARDAKLVKQHYDETASQFIDALQAALPEALRMSLSWGYNLAIATLVIALSKTDRPQRLGHGEEKISQEDVLCTLITYVEGGIRALIAREPSG